jgi:ribosome-associated protein
MDKEKLLNEFQFKAVRSSGAGGQNVNKVSSKVVLSFDVANSVCFSEDEKARIKSKLSSKLTNEGILILQCDEDRSQFKNKNSVIKRCFEMLEKAMRVSKRRVATKIPKSVIEKRIKNKKLRAYSKQSRKKPNTE